MRFRALGPLRVVIDGDECAIPAPRQRTVLAVLILERNRLVPLPRLVDALWADDPPATARSQVQICVSALRRRFLGWGGDAIRTHGPGYELVVPAGGCDLDEMERLLSDARAALRDGSPERAAETYRTALGLWRGDALADVDSALVRSAVIGLHHLRLAVTEELVDVQLALGRHEEATLQLAALVPADPLREGLRWRLMLALHRCGRPAEALEVYADLRRSLVEQLGIEPGQRVRDVQRAILADGPVIGRSHLAATPDPSPRHLPPAIAVLTGRAEQAAAVGGLLTVGDAPTVVVTGAAGVGKSALAIWVGHRVTPEFPDGQLFARATGSTPHRVLGRFLCALGTVRQAVPGGLDERTDMFRSMVAGRRLLILVDDVASEEQILPVLPGSAGPALLVTSRGRMPGLADARRVEVGVLDEASAVELLAATADRGLGPAERAAARRLVAQCGCLPLALRIAGSRLAARPHWAVGDLSRRLEDETRRLDELAYGGLSVRSSLARSYEVLCADARRLLRVLSVLDVGGWVAESRLDTVHPEAMDALEELIDARLVEAVAGPGGTRFRLPELVRVYARERPAGVAPSPKWCPACAVPRRTWC